MENIPIKSQKKATLVMMPMPLGSMSADSMFHREFESHITEIHCWVVENARTFRRFVSSLKLSIDIEKLNIFELYRDYDKISLIQFLNNNIRNGSIGVASEAGVPGMADPGAEIASWAHGQDVPVISVTGPSSLLLALSGSGLNGQQFCFHGYAPVKEEELRTFVGKLGKDCEKTGYTQALIEAPYRSDRLLTHLLGILNDSLKICIACNLHETDGFIKTQTVAAWKASKVTLGKKPCIFLVGR
jgi:16S rRNA (cytidine1402-2'-O)-methyltransferase